MPLDINYHMSQSDLDKLSVLEDKIIVEVFDNRNKTKSGIELPITSENPFVPSDGIVFKVQQNSDFKIGDSIVFEKYRGTRLYPTDTNRQFILMDIVFVIAKIV